jgi:hypothetical protein
MHDAVLAKNCDWRAKELGRTLKAAKFTGDVFSVAATVYVKRKQGGRGLVQIKAEIINIAEYQNTNYKEDQSVNIVKSHEISQPNINSTVKMAAKITE